MDLGAYLGWKRINKKQFAKMLGCSLEHFSQSLRGKRIPSSQLAFKVEEITEGKVKAEEFLTYCIKEFKLRKKGEQNE